MNSVLTPNEAMIPNSYRRALPDTARRPVIAARATVDHADPIRLHPAAGASNLGGRLRPARLVAELLSERARPLRFLLVGGLCGVVQLGLLALFIEGGVQAILANALAFLLSAQLNFGLSQWFIWGDRRTREWSARRLMRRWLAFHASIAGTAVLNQGVFVLARVAMQDLPASAAGIGVAAAINFLIQDRLVFPVRRHPATRPSLHAVAVAPASAAVPPPLTVVRPPGKEREPFRPAPDHAAAPNPRPAGVRVDVVIPVYNEEHVLAASIGRLRAFLTEHLPHDWRIVIADNASTDGTLTVAGALSRSLPRVTALHLDQKGRGRALKAAWLGSDAEVLSYMDVDLSTDLAAYPPLIDAVARRSCDIATGRRLGKGARVERRRLLREITSRGYNLLIKLAFRPQFTDAQCGFKAISRSAAQALLPQVENNEWLFDTELLLIATKHGYRIAQVPVHWVDDPDSRVNVTRTAVEDLKGLWRLKRAGY